MDRLTPSELDAVYAAKRPATWPAVGIVSVVKRLFHGEVDYLGEVEDFSVYGVHDKGLNFILALYHIPRKQALVTEIALLASFADYAFDQTIVEKINPHLHLGEAVVDGRELFLAAKIAPRGRFKSGPFSVMIDTWRHDLVVTQKIVLDSHDGKGGSVRFARALAVEALDGAPAAEVIRSMFAAQCRPCLGRGRTGLFRRACDACGGSGVSRASGH
ncbi:MAG: hypothetical protein K2Q06_11180 [Parvularculaceae bacterium]|nr:hypothetical protein [Parvularculaceae bacterium]